MAAVTKNFAIKEEKSSEYGVNFQILYLKKSRPFLDDLASGVTKYWHARQIVEIRRP
jgi:hypothetical protein